MVSLNFGSTRFIIDFTICLGVKYSPKSFSVEVVCARKYSKASPLTSLSIVDNTRGSSLSIIPKSVFGFLIKSGVKTSPLYFYEILFITKSFIKPIACS